MSKYNLVIFCVSWVLLVPTTGKTEEVNKSAGVRISPKWVESAKKALPNIIDQHGRAIKAAGKKYDVPQRLVVAFIATESLNVSGAVSSKGAKGLMQIMPDAQEHVRKEFGLKCDITKPNCNILTGTAYLSIIGDSLPNYCTLVKCISYAALAYNSGLTEARRRMRHGYGASGHQYVQKVKHALRMMRELALL